MPNVHRIAPLLAAVALPLAFVVLSIVGVGGAELAVVFELHFKEGVDFVVVTLRGRGGVEAFQPNVASRRRDIGVCVEL